MKVEYVSYSHTVVDNNGDKHEVGLQGSLEEGDTMQTAMEQIQKMVYSQTQPFVTDYDAQIEEASQESQKLDSEISYRTQKLNEYAQFAKANGLDFNPPSYIIEENNEQ